VPVFDQDDFIKLSSRGLKSLHVMTGGSGVTLCVQDMLSSSLNTPAQACI
jgi:hypothetical protein